MKTFSAVGLILKRTNTGEFDRVVTVFTKEQGKLICVAKGARKLTSSKLAALEPGCLVKLHLVKTQSLPILTQAQIIDDFSSLKTSLNSMRKFFQILEMLDALLVEADEQQEVFQIALALLTQMKDDESNKTHIVRSAFGRIFAILGFEIEQGDQLIPMAEQIQKLTDRRMKAFAYLSTT